MRTFKSVGIFAVLLLTLLGSVPAGAKPAGRSCKMTAWPFAREQTPRQLGKIFYRADREALRQYLFHEMTTQQKPALTRKIASYLIDTERDERRKNFYEGLIWMAGLHFEKPSPVPRDRLCSVYSDFLAGE
jgi:hypothetical protein